jgi:hypothetical protein
MADIKNLREGTRPGHGFSDSHWYPYSEGHKSARHGRGPDWSTGRIYPPPPVSNLININPDSITELRGPSSRKAWSTDSTRAPTRGKLEQTMLYNMQKRQQRQQAAAPSRSAPINVANLPYLKRSDRIGAAMHITNERAFNSPGILKRARNYVQAGGMMQSGMERMAGQHAAGQQFYRWGNSFYRTSASSGPMGPQLLGGASINAEGNLVGKGGKTLVNAPNGRPLSGKAATLFGRQMPWTAAGVAGSVGVAGTAYFAYLGYKGEISGNSGMSGVVDAGIIDLATMSGVAKFSSVATAVSAGVVSTGRVGFLRSLPMFIGAAVGASVGHGALGAPGAFAGGYVGAALGRAPLRLAAAGAVIGGSVAVGKGAYNLLKTGYRKRTASRGINTAGDMAAFYTQNAMTMRARAVGAIRNSHTNARSALGQEANFMHTNKNYFSPYRR